MEKKKMEYVDLGLPSGLLWAKCNLGANSPEESGTYFQWGTIMEFPNEDLTLSKYHFFNEDNYYFTKYNSTDNKLSLDSKDDASKAILGLNWSIPTNDNIRELFENTNKKTGSINGINGIYFYSKSNINFIFIPYAGIWKDNLFKGKKDSFMLWTSNVDEKDTLKASCLFGYNGSTIISHINREYGLNIRPVYKFSHLPEFYENFLTTFRENYPSDKTYRIFREHFLECEDTLRNKEYVKKIIHLFYGFHKEYNEFFKPLNYKLQIFYTKLLVDKWNNQFNSIIQKARKYHTYELDKELFKSFGILFNIIKRATVYKPMQQSLSEKRNVYNSIKNKFLKITKSTITGVEISYFHPYQYLSSDDSNVIIGKSIQKFEYSIKRYTCSELQDKNIQLEEISKEEWLRIFELTKIK